KHHTNVRMTFVNTHQYSTLYQTHVLVADPPHDLDLHPQPLHVLRDPGPSAVDHDRVHADVLQEHDVARELLPQDRIGHGRAAVLDHDRLAVELPDVRERLEQRRDLVRGLLVHVVYSALIVT